MIKPLAILVALAGSAGAYATQSTFFPPENIPEGAGGKTTLSIYGLLDLNIQHLNSGSLSQLGGYGLWRLADGTAYGPGSRLDFKINQDLGNGWNAGALLEMGYNANNSTLAQGGRIFGRQGFAFLKSNSLGEFRFGRQYMLHDDSVNSTNPTGGTTVLAPGSITTVPAGLTALWVDASRIDNSLQYTSPAFYGFLAKGMLAFSQQVQDRYEAAKVVYNSGQDASGTCGAAGPVGCKPSAFGIEAVYEQSKPRVPVIGKSTVNKIFQLGANYDFGVARVFAGYQRDKDLTTGSGTQVGTWTLPLLTGPATELKSYNIGASTWVGQSIVFVNYTHTNYTNAAGASVTISRYGPGVTYFYDKQTVFYGAVGITGGGLKDYVNEKVLAQVGFRKFF